MRSCHFLRPRLGLALQFGNAGPVLTFDPFDFVLVKLVVRRRIRRAENGRTRVLHLDQDCNASVTAWHTWSICASSSASPEGRYSPCRAMRFAV